MTLQTLHLKGFIRYLRNTKAVSALEYAVLVGAVAMAMVIAAATFNEDIKNTLQTIAANLNSTATKVGTP